jgi:ribokinase
MIYVVGNVTIDSIYSVSHLPRPGETIVAIGKTEELGGKGANQAMVIARCGLPVALVAALGNDEPAVKAKKTLLKEGVQLHYLCHLPCATDTSSIYVDETGENHIVSVIEAARAFNPFEELSGVLKPNDVLLFQGNLRPDVLRACVGLAKSRGAFSLLNPSPVYSPDEYDWEKIDTVIMNRLEAGILTSRPTPQQAAEELCKAGVKTCIVTLGREGAFFLNEAKKFVLPAPDVNAVDTTGAGDVFCGVFVASTVKDHPPEIAVANAIKAAALAVTRKGTSSSFPSPNELNFLRTQNHRTDQ